MLLTTIYSHGVITSPTPRTVIGDSDDQRWSGINNNIVYEKALKKASGTMPPSPDIPVGPGVLTRAQMDSNMVKLNQVYPDSFPCRYNDNWQNTNQLSGQISVKYFFHAIHTGTCMFSLLKKGQFAAALGEPYQCSKTAGEETHAVTLPAGTSCTAADQCTIQWYWNGGQKDQQYVNCIDFVSGANTAQNTTLPATAPATPPTTAAPATPALPATPAVAQPVAPVAPLAPVVDAVPPVGQPVQPVQPAPVPVDDTQCIKKQ
eukprot:NODE_269_length_11261_cov_0.600359.p8 type:complete len:261 gc:universal NODE_269_length_11261_cov_0.600359:4605-3823(-)